MVNPGKLYFASPSGDAYFKVGNVRIEGDSLADHVIYNGKAYGPSDYVDGRYLRFTKSQLVDSKLNPIDRKD